MAEPVQPLACLSIAVSKLTGIDGGAADPTEVEDVCDVHAIERYDPQQDFVWEFEQTAAICLHKRVTVKGVTGS